MNYIDLVQENIIQIGVWVGAIIAYVIDRKRRKAETQTLQGSALEQIQNAYDRYVADSNREYDELKSKIDTLIASDNEKTIKILELEKKNLESQSQIKELTEKVKHYELKIKALTSKIQHYEQEIEKYRERVNSLENK